MAFGAHVQAMASLTSAASGTTTIWSAVSGARFHITKGFISIITAAATGLGVSIIESEPTASDSAVLFRVDHGTAGMHSFDFGEHGYAAASVGSRLAVSQDGDATINCVFVGYRI